MLRTGKSGKYRYYNCASTQTKSTASCGDPARFPEAKLDELVTDALLRKILTPARFRPLLEETFKQMKDQNQGARSALTALRRSLRDTEKKIENLYKAIEDGLVGDTASFRQRLTNLEEERSESLRLIGIRERELALPIKRLSNSQLERMAGAIRETLKSGPTAFRKAYLKLLVEKIEVSSNVVKITGSKVALADAIQSEQPSNGEVGFFEREWRSH